MVVGNITTTTVRGLSPNVTYAFGIAGLNENQTNPSWWDNLDLYGRRDALAGALEGAIATVQGHTLLHDVNIPYFNSNATQDYGAETESLTKGPTGVYGGEGHYGLSLIGSANIAKLKVNRPRRGHGRSSSLDVSSEVRKVSAAEMCLWGPQGPVLSELPALTMVCFLYSKKSPKGLGLSETPDLKSLAV